MLEAVVALHAAECAFRRFEKGTSIDAMKHELNLAAEDAKIKYRNYADCLRRLHQYTVPISASSTSSEGMKRAENDSRSWCETSRDEFDHTDSQSLSETSSDLSSVVLILPQDLPSMSTK